jgi:TBC1 domain family member 20
MEPNGRVVEETEKPEELPSNPDASSPPLRSKESNAKVASILDACKWKDTSILRTLATSEGGLVSDEVRRQACQCYSGNVLFETDLQ